MTHRRLLSMAAACALIVVPGYASVVHAQLTPYSQDFEGLNQADPGALAGDGWLVFGNVFFFDGSSLNFLYPYGPFQAPNNFDDPAFSLVAAGEGGAPQGAQQLVVFSDYRNQDHNNGFLIESNVFQEQIIGAADVGNGYTFTFDAKLGDIGGDSTALAFIKTLDPSAGFALTNFITEDMTSIPATWGTYSLSIGIDAGLAGQILQFGFLNTATLYQPSGILYDNIHWQPDGASGTCLDIKPGACPNPINPRSRGYTPMALTGSADFDVTQVDMASLSLARADGVGGNVSPWEGPPGPHTTIADVAIATCDGEPCACTDDEGGDGFDDLDMHFKTQDMVEALELDDLPGGTELELCVSGTLLDGTPFEACDCVIIVPVGDDDEGGDGNAVIRADGDGFIELSPPDLWGSEGGTGTLGRWYVPGTELTATAAPASDAPTRSDSPVLGDQASVRFSHWMVDGVPQPTGQRTISVIVESWTHPAILRAVYHKRRSSR